LIAGERYPFNPAEAFVFGGAVLTHDAALCFEAYEGGQRGLRETVEWKDAYAAVEARAPHSAEESRLEEADFTAMRVLHASRASDLAHASWTTPEGERLYLIENYELRKHYGQLIGSIAASHHWSIEDVASRLPSQLNAPASMPREWRVDPVKIACLLRCADAAHLDSRRAPDFLRAMASLHGVSAQHWTAQNWLERADSDAEDPEGSSIIFTSGKPFDQANAEAWWVAYDAVRLVDKELASASDLLERRPQSAVSPPFKMRRVTGATSPVLARRSIATTGWIPQAVEIHVSNLERLISRLGGANLYGERGPLIVVMRELVQNARDSVMARRSLDKEYVGRIRIRHQIRDGNHTISVEDDGVGMSYRVMTGPLLDFGASFWASELVRNEFPGLLSGGYASVGKFGIGFYSVFMVASSVSVTSRRFDAGLSSATQVLFPKGLSLRPIIASGAPKGFGFSNSTVVELNLKRESGDPSTLLIMEGRPGYESELRLPIAQCLSIICAGLDVTVELIGAHGSAQTVHRPLAELDTFEKRRDWLLEIAGADSQSKEAEILVEHAGRLRPIVAGGRIMGLAALSTARTPGHRGFVTVSTVGGLASSISAGDWSRFVGSIDYMTETAKREPSKTPAAGEAAFEAWAAEQKTLLPARESNPVAWCFATSSLASLGCDPFDIAMMVVRDGDKYSALTTDQVIDLMQTRGIAVYESGLIPHVEQYHSQECFEGMPTFWPITNSEFLSLYRDEHGQPRRTSFLSCLERAASVRGLDIEAEYSPTPLKGHFRPIKVLLLRAKSRPEL